MLWFAGGLPGGAVVSVLWFAGGLPGGAVVSVCCGSQADCQVELQLFKLYHNEQEIDGLAGELASKNQQLQKEMRKRDRVEEGVKEKKKEAGKMSRELAKIEQRMKESVSTTALLLLCLGRLVWPFDGIVQKHIHKRLIQTLKCSFNKHAYKIINSHCQF